MSLLMNRVRTVMIFAADPPAVAEWYAPLFGDPEIRTDPSGDGVFAWFEADGVELAFHPADRDKNPVGRSVVMYWAVTSLEHSRAALIERGASPHRGPLEVDPTRSICQLLDPFGNVFGLDGPR